MMENYINNLPKKFNIVSIIFRLSGVVGKNSHSYISRVLKKIDLGEKIIFSNPNLKFNTFIHVDNFADIVSSFIKLHKINCIFNIGTIFPLKLKSIIFLLNFIKYSQYNSPLEVSMKTFSQVPNTCGA